MRILFIAHRIPYPPNKGEKIRALWELRELCREHVVDLFCFCDDAEDRKFISKLKDDCDRLYVENLSFLGSRARALWALLTGRPFSVGFFHSPTMAKQIDSALGTNIYDRVFVYSSSMAQYAERETGVPRVLDLVDVDSDKWLQYAERSRWPWSGLWRKEAQRLSVYEEQLVRHYPLTLVCTEAEAELLRSRAPVGRIEVLQNFLDAAYYDPTRFVAPGHIRELQPYLVFSGSMDYRPNVDAALFFCREVFPLIRQAMPELRVVIAGRNPHPSVAALGSDPAIRVTGTVADMRPYIWGASAAVVPMRIARGVQNKILEALASGTPVVSTSAAAMALPTAVRSLLRVADSPQAIAGTVLDLVKGRTNQASHSIRAAFREYIEGLNLHSKLRQIMLDPLQGNENSVKARPVEPSRCDMCDPVQR
jgi:polysaccharide biosynthesis protein PslH